MNGQRLRYTLGALLGGVAVTLAAAMLHSPSQSNGLSGGTDGASGLGSLLRELPETSISLPDLPWYLDGLVTLFAVFLAAAAVYAVIYNTREMLRQMARAVGFGVFVFVAVYASVVAGKYVFDSGEFGFAGDSTLGITQGETGGGVVTTVPPLVVLVFAVTGLFVVGGAVLFGESDDDTETETRQTDKADTAAISRAAGRVADRLEDADTTENEIYRAWVEMGQLVDISNPETKTTREFEQAAVDAGLTPQHVRELTALFEQVRYGGDTPSEDDEQRAVSLFRDIEETYEEERV